MNWVKPRLYWGNLLVNQIACWITVIVTVSKINKKNNGWLVTFNMAATVTGWNLVSNILDYYKIVPWVVIVLLIKDRLEKFYNCLRNSRKKNVFENLLAISLHHQFGCRQNFLLLSSIIMHFVINLLHPFFARDNSIFEQLS